MRIVKKLTGALVMAGLVAGVLAVSATPAAAEPVGNFKGQTMLCSAIRTAASSVPSATAEAILWALYESKCM
jgi:hypothetical protein